MDVIRPFAAHSSSSRCASLKLTPPGTTVPVPGMTSGSQPSQVEADVKSGSAVIHDLECLARYPAHSELVDFAHGERRDAGLADELALEIVDIAYPDEDNVLRVDSGVGAQNAGQFRISVAQQVRKRHAVHISARRGFGKIHVARGHQTR